MSGPRVLQALAGAPHGGAEMHFVRLAEALARAGLTQHAVVRHDAPRREALEAAGIGTTELPFGSPFDARTMLGFRRAVAAFRPDIVLTYMSRATRFCPKGDFVHIARLGGYYPLKHYRRCGHLVGITPDLVEYFRANGWPPARTHFIPNFVADRPRPEAADRARHDTPANAPLVFALGRLHRNKAFDTLIAAVAGIPDAHLWLAGEGPERTALERLAGELGVAHRVRFLGWQDDPGALFAAADVYVVPSRHEPLGSVLLEGWMYGVPMVATASQGASFLLRDGETGLMVPVDDAAAMAAAIRRVLDDPALARSLVAEGRRAFERDFTEDVAVERYLALFDRVLAERRTAA